MTIGGRGAPWVYRARRRWRRTGETRLAPRPNQHGGDIDEQQALAQPSRLSRKDRCTARRSARTVTSRAGSFQFGDGPGAEQAPVTAARSVRARSFLVSASLSRNSCSPTRMARPRVPGCRSPQTARWTCRDRANPARRCRQPGVQGVDHKSLPAAGMRPGGQGAGTNPETVDQHVDIAHQDNIQIPRGAVGDGRALPSASTGAEPPADRPDRPNWPAR